MPETSREIGDSEREKTKEEKDCNKLVRLNIPS